MAYTVDGLSYDKRYKLDLQTTYLDANQTGFPCLVQFSNDSNMADANNDGFDIRFTASDGTTLLKYERESWAGGASSNVTANFWVKSDLATAGTTIYCYWRSTDTADGADPANVWDSNYKAVWHMSEASGTVYDSTANANNLASAGSPTYGDTGKIGKAMTFNGSSQYLEKTSAVLTAPPFTMSAWVYQHTNAAYNSNQRFVTLGSSTAGTAFSLHSENAAGVLKTMTQHHDNVNLGGSAKTTAVTLNTWQYITGTWTANNSRSVFLNSASKVTNTDAMNALTQNRTNIGVLVFAGSYYHYFDGSIDEARISNVVRADAWIKFEYYNMNEADNEWDKTYQASSTANTSAFFRMF